MAYLWVGLETTRGVINEVRINGEMRRDEEKRIGGARRAEEAETGSHRVM